MNLFFPIFGCLSLGIVVRLFFIHRKLKYKEDKQDNYAESIVGIVLSGLIAFLVSEFSIIGFVFVALAGWILKKLCEKANKWHGEL